MKKETSRRRRLRILFRRRLRHYRRLFGKLRRAGKAWLRRHVAALKASDDYGIRFVRETPWRKFRSILLLLVAFVVLGISFGPGLLCWFGGLWNSEDLDGIYYLRSPLITAGAGLLAAFVAACFFAWRNWIAGKQLEYTNEQLKNTNKQLETSQEQLENAQLSLQEERYKKGVELLGHKSQVVRIGGLYALHQLAEDSPKTWALPVLDLMCLFVRTPPRDEEKTEKTSDEDKADGSRQKKLRRDVQEAIQLLGIRGNVRRETEKHEQEKVKKGGIGKSPGGGRLDFHEAGLVRGIWPGVNLERAFFFGAKLDEANFEGATLEGAIFYQAKLTGANFFGAKLEGANFDGATLVWAKFFRAKLEGANFSFAKLTEARFDRATLEKAKFFEAKLGGARFDGAKLEGAGFNGAKLEGANFSFAKLRGADFREATLADAHFGGATLTSADFSGVAFEGAHFRRTELIGANFRGAVLGGADFSGSTLVWARFNGATLTEARFERVWLEKADFGEAKLEGANFEGAKLTSADFGGANITRASLMHANLSEVVLLVHKTITGKDISKPVRGATRKQLEAGWIEEGRPPVKVVEDASGSRTTTPLTEANWKEIGLDPPPRLRQGSPQSRWRRSLAEGEGQAGGGLDEGSVVL